MSTARVIPSDVAFTKSVKDVQRRLGSRAAYERMERGGGWSTTVDADLAAFISEQTSFFLATANAEGQPYIQHRGGPPGFLRVLDERTLGFADFRGNRQYITTGNLAENPRVHLFLIDYEHRQRVKIWGEARVDETDLVLRDRLTVQDADAKRARSPQAERSILIHVTAWDANCPQHIPQRFDAKDVEAAIEARDRRIAELEAELRAANASARGAR